MYSSVTETSRLAVDSASIRFAGGSRWGDSVVSGRSWDDDYDASPGMNTNGVADAASASARYMEANSTVVDSR